MWTREIELQHNRPLRVERSGATIECKAGTVWVTNPALAGDLFLRAGERQRLPGGTTLVEALGCARIVLHPRATPWHRAAAAVSRFCLDWARRRASQYAEVYLSKH
jgi:hypothetical protein